MSSQPLSINDQVFTSFSFLIGSNSTNNFNIHPSVADLQKQKYQLYRNTPGKRQSKMPILSRNVDKKLLETEFSIAICRQSDNKWLSKTLFLSIFDQSLLIVDSLFDCRLPSVRKLLVTACLMKVIV